MTTCQDNAVPIVQGANLWILARTDRDGATSEQVLETAGAFLARELGGASPFQLRSFTEHLSTRADGHQARFIIGAARPVTVTVTQADSPSSTVQLVPRSGRVLANRQDCDVLRTVNAQRPWIVTAEFDWRAPDTRVDWPRRKSLLGFPSRGDHDLDWLLLGAAHLGQPLNDDTSWTSEVSEQLAADLSAAAKRAAKVASEEAQRFAVGLIGAAVVVGGGYLIWKNRNRRRLKA